VFTAALWITALSGGLAVVAGFVAGYVGYELSEKSNAPRSVSAAHRNRIVEQMKQFAPQEYAGRVAAGSDDAWDLWREISLALELAGWKRVGPFPPVGQPPYGPPATIASAPMPGVMVWFPATGWNDIRPRAVALAAAIRDNGNGVLAGPGGMADSNKIIVIEIGPNPHQPASAYHGPE
jgi:hypothetical protein